MQEEGKRIDQETKVDIDDFSELSEAAGSNPNIAEPPAGAPVQEVGEVVPEADGEKEFKLELGEVDASLLSVLGFSAEARDEISAWDPDVLDDEQLRERLDGLSDAQEKTGFREVVNYLTDNGEAAHVQIEEIFGGSFPSEDDLDVIMTALQGIGWQDDEQTRRFVAAGMVWDKREKVKVETEAQPVGEVSPAEALPQAGEFLKFTQAEIEALGLTPKAEKALEAVMLGEGAGIAVSAITSKGVRGALREAGYGGNLGQEEKVLQGLQVKKLEVETALEVAEKQGKKPRDKGEAFAAVLGRETAGETGVPLPGEEIFETPGSAEALPQTETKLLTPAELSESVSAVVGSRMQELKVERQGLESKKKGVVGVLLEKGQNALASVAELSRREKTKKAKADRLWKSYSGIKLALLGLEDGDLQDKNKKALEAQLNEVTQAYVEASKDANKFSENKTVLRKRLRGFLNGKQALVISQYLEVTGEMTGLRRLEKDAERVVDYIQVVQTNEEKRANFLADPGQQALLEEADRVAGSTGIDWLATGPVAVKVRMLNLWANKSLSERDADGVTKWDRLARASRLRSKGEALRIDLTDAEQLTAKDAPRILIEAVEYVKRKKEAEEAGETFTAEGLSPEKTKVLEFIGNTALGLESTVPVKPLEAEAPEAEEASAELPDEDKLKDFEGRLDTGLGGQEKIVELERLETKFITDWEKEAVDVVGAEVVFEDPGDQAETEKLKRAADGLFSIIRNKELEDILEKALQAKRDIMNPKTRKGSVIWLRTLKNMVNGLAEGSIKSERLAEDLDFMSKLVERFAAHEEVFKSDAWQSLRQWAEKVREVRG